MLGVHALIGIGEALITVAALVFIFQTRPDLLGESSPSVQSGRGWVVVGVLMSLAVVLLSPLASANPDGLERVAEDLGFLSRGQSAPYEILPDYTVPFLGATPFSTILAGAIGVVVVLILAVLAGRTLQRKSEIANRKS
jgi:cobalt/nickel transport system permease protein